MPHQPLTFSSDDDGSKIRLLSEQVRQLQSALDRLTHIINDYQERNVSAFDEAGNPRMYRMLVADHGDGTVDVSGVHPYTVEDASAGGVHQVTVVPGTHNNGGNPGASIIPTIGGTPINAVTPPTLTLGGGGTIYFAMTLDGDFGNSIVSIAIMDGASLPSGNPGTPGGMDYYLVTTYNITDGVLTINNDGPAGSQQYYVCGNISQSVLY